MPEEWEQKRMGDDELTDFDIFVQNEAKESEDLWWLYRQLDLFNFYGFSLKFRFFLNSQLIY